MTSNLPTFDELTIRNGLYGILKEPSRIGCDAACQRSLGRFLDQYLGTECPDKSVKQQSSSYFYSKDCPRQFFSIVHDAGKNKSYLGYHFSEQIPSPDTPNEQVWAWHFGKEEVDWTRLGVTVDRALTSAGTKEQTESAQQEILTKLSRATVMAHSRAEALARRRQDPQFDALAYVHNAFTRAERLSAPLLKTFAALTERSTGELVDTMLLCTTPGRSSKGSTFYAPKPGEALKWPEHDTPDAVVSTSEIQEPPSSPTETQPPPSSTIGTQPPPSSTQDATKVKEGSLFRRIRGLSLHPSEAWVGFRRPFVRDFIRTTI
jgi:hypothetical protein